MELRIERDGLSGSGSCGTVSSGSFPSTPPSPPAHHKFVYQNQNLMAYLCLACDLRDKLPFLWGLGLLKWTQGAQGDENTKILPAGEQGWRTSDAELGVLKGDLDVAAGQDLQAVAQAQSGHDGLGGRQAGQRGQLVAHIELNHVVQRRCGSGNDLVHLRHNSPQRFTPMFLKLFVLQLGDSYIRISRWARAQPR